MSPNDDTPITKLEPEQSDNALHAGETLLSPEEIDELMKAVLYDEN